MRLKRIWGLLIFCLFLSGCKSEEDAAISLRQRVLKADHLQFQAEITADYGDTLSVFTLDCVGLSDGSLAFTVTAPESISGIRGTLASGTGKLHFEDKALSFPLVADGLLSPVSAPWIFYNTLRSGNLLSSGREGAYTRLTIDDSFREDALRLDIWLDGAGNPVRSDVSHRGQNCLSLALQNFRTPSDSGT